MSANYCHRKGMAYGMPFVQRPFPPNWTWDHYKVFLARQQAGCNPPFYATSFGANNAVVAAPVVMSSNPPSAQRFASTDSVLHPQSSSQVPTLELVGNLPVESRSELLLVVLHLQRRSPSRPWGLGFVQNNDLGQIIVSNVDLSTNSMTARTHVLPLTDQVLDPTIVYSPSGVKSCTDSSSDAHTAYVQHLFETTAPYDVSSKSYFHKCHARICPGDILVCMDGGSVLPSSPFSPSSVACTAYGGHSHRAVSFPSLDAVTSHLRMVDSVCIVLLRSPRATTAAMAGGSKIKTEKTNPFQSASRATAVWMTILPRNAPPFVQNPVKAVEDSRSAEIIKSVSTPPSAWPQTSLCMSSQRRMSELTHHTPVMSMHQLMSHQNKSVFPPSQPNSVSDISGTIGNDTILENPESHPPLAWQERLNEMDSLEMLSHLASMQDLKRGHNGGATGVVVSNWTPPVEVQHRKEKATNLKRSHATKATVKLEKNPWFQEVGGKGDDYILYDDNSDEYIKEDGTRAGLFLPPIGNFNDWLSRRKAIWRHRYRVCIHSTPEEMQEKKSDGPQRDDNVRETSSVAHDFWNEQGYSSFSGWLSDRTLKWKMSYSWNTRKRRRIQKDCMEIVHLSSSKPSIHEFRHWLHVRRYQWRMFRRQRHRLTKYRELSSGDPHSRLTGSFDAVQENRFSLSDKCHSPSSIPHSTLSTMRMLSPASPLKLLCGEDKEIAFIDEILEAEEEQHRRRNERPPIEIKRFFDSSQGIPDDVIAHCLGYLPCMEHAKLFHIDRSTCKYLRQRQEVWRSLCPQQWVLPRRPRKPWHDLYLSKLKEEYSHRQKQSDDLLCKCSVALSKGDVLQKIEKLVQNAEKDAGFDINYVSGVVCERNSILNLAVIHRRHKVVRWLVDVKGADIETADRGNFTPLLNAAWAGDRFLVRFFLQRGSNRNVLGTQHYSQGIARPGFEGLTADNWAEKRGFPDIAKLIQIGL